MKERKFREPLLDKWHRKYRRYAPRNIMLYIVIITALVWFLDMIVMTKTNYEFSIRYWLAFNKPLILKGEVWRLVSFIFLPSDDYSLFYLALGLYIDWLIANALEGEWGALRFDIFYLCGIIGAIVSGMITGYATNEYLNLSLFLAFAILNPDYQLLIFFIIPIKVKWLAIIDFVGLLLLFILGTWWTQLSLLMAFANIILFFGGHLYQKIKNFFRRKKYKREAKRNEKDYPFDL